MVWAASAPDVQQNPDHYGKFVVVHKKGVLGFGSDRQALVQELAEREQIPWQQLVVIVVARPTPTPEQPQHLCLDKGYDYPIIRELCASFGFVAHIRARGEEARDIKRQRGYKARRWVVERTHHVQNCSVNPVENSRSALWSRVFHILFLLLGRQDESIGRRV